MRVIPSVVGLLVFFAIIYLVASWVDTLSGVYPT